MSHQLLDRASQTLECLIQCVLEECGDGWGIWYTQKFKLREVIDLVKHRCNLPNHWKYSLFDEGILLGDGAQEWLLITTSQHVFDEYDGPTYEVVLRW